MNPAEIRSVFSELDADGTDIGEVLGVDRETLRAWESGTKRLPGIRARQISWLQQELENRRQRHAADLPVCPELDPRIEEFEALDDPPTEELERLDEWIHGHMESCEICQKNQAWEQANLTPLGPFPMTGFVGRSLELLVGLPTSLIPTVVGAALLAAIVGLRLVFAAGGLLISGASPTEIVEFGVQGAMALAAASGAGAAGGLIVPVLGPLRRRLPVVGVYVTGVLVVMAYMVSLALVAPIAFGETIVTDRSGWIILAIVAAGFGLLGAHSYRRA